MMHDNNVFAFDSSRCTGCCACQVACKDNHNLGADVYFRRVSAEDGHFLSAACHHCENPACVAACKPGAMQVAEDGTVQHNAARCVSCGVCWAACPYGAIAHDERRYIGKCDACANRRKSGYGTACATACPVGALHFAQRGGTRA